MFDSASLPLSRSPAPPLYLLRLIFLTLAGTLGLAALYLIARRLSGALVAPLDFVPALAIGLLIAFGTWSLRRLALTTISEQPRMVIGIIAFTWLLVVGLTLSGTSSLAVLALWLPVIATEAYWQVAGASPAPPLPRFPASQLSSSPAAPETLFQQLTRSREDGQEFVRGTARIEFASGEQTAALHLAFCPPLASDPQVEADVVDADGISIRATDRRSYGIRLEARRKDTAAPLTVLVSFEAVSTGP